MRAFIRFSEESRQRNLYVAKTGDLVEALIDTARECGVLRGDMRDKGKQGL